MRRYFVRHNVLLGYDARSIFMHMQKYFSIDLHQFRNISFFLFYARGKTFDNFVELKASVVSECF